MYLHEAAVRQDDLCTTYDHILYIAELAYELVRNGDLPSDCVQDYARRYTVALKVHPNMRDFVARQAREKVEQWQRQPLRMAQ